MFDKIQYLIEIPSKTFSNNKEISYFYKYRKDEQTLSDKIEEIVNNYELIYYVDDDKLHPLYEFSKIAYYIRGNKIKIFGKQFVTKYKNDCIIIYDDKIYPLMEYFPVEYINRKKNYILEIILRELIDIPDKSYMFDNCTSLIGFRKFKDWRELDKYIVKGEKYIFYEDTNEFEAFNSKKKKYSIEKGLILEKGKISRITKENPSLIEINNSNKDNIFDQIYIFDLSFMFNGCSSLIHVPDTINWEIKSVTKMIKMFS